VLRGQFGTEQLFYLPGDVLRLRFTFVRADEATGPREQRFTATRPVSRFA
jgi:hypothetical protein